MITTNIARSAVAVNVIDTNYVPVAWNLLRKIGGVDGVWDAGGFGTLALTGDFDIEMQLLGLASEMMHGASADNPDENFNTIDWAMYQTGSSFIIYENGGLRASFPALLSMGDILALKRIGSELTYWHEGVKKYTSLITSSATLFTDCSLKTTGKTIKSRIDSLPTVWGSLVNVTDDGNVV